MARGLHRNQPTTSRGWIDAHLARCRETGKSRGTLDVKTRQINNLFEFLGEPENWDDVEPEDIHRYLARPRLTPTGRPAEDSLSRDLSILRTFFTFIMDNGGLTVHPIPSKTNFDLPAFEVSEPREPMHPDNWVKVWTSPRVTSEDRLWLGLGYYCGLRREEMALIAPGGVQHRDGKPGSGTLRFRRKGAKKDSGIAYAAIVDILSDPHLGMSRIAIHGHEWMDLLEWTARFRRHEERLLPSSDERSEEGASRFIYDRLRTVQRAAGIPRSEWVCPHNLRHSAATNLALCGVPDKVIQRQLSHSNDSMTARYITTAGQDLRRWHDQQKRLPA